MKSTTRQLYVLGCGLGVLGSLVTVVGLAIIGTVDSAVSISAFGAMCVYALGLRNTFQREDFERDHSLGYRVANLAGAAFVVGLGLLMVAVGFFVLSFG